MRAREEFLTERARQIQTMLDRARDRGENPPETLEILDHVLAPMSIRVLFGSGTPTPDHAGTLIDRLLATPR